MMIGSSTWKCRSIDEHNWSERSLSYLCRTFDQLYQGQDYEEALPVHHIGFLDFTLFPEYPEFYATYQLLNVKNHHLYSSKFSLSVVDLSQTKLATKEDIAYGIDHWARLFKAKTWEEMKMLVKNDEYLEAAANSLFEANEERMVRERCIARKLAERRERTLERDIKLLKENIGTLKETNSTLTGEISALGERNSALEAQNNSLETRIKELEALLEKQDMQK